MRTLPRKMHMKAGRYYYVTTEGGRTRWIGLSRDYNEALEQHAKLLGGEITEADFVKPPSPPPAWLEQVAPILHARVRARAAAAKIYCSLTRDDIRKLGERQNWRCALTGLAFSRDRTENEHARALGPSIDRIDSRQGYTIDNCRMVCVAVNYALNEWGESMFRKIAAAYFKHRPARHALNSSKQPLRIPDSEQGPTIRNHETH